jgi:hypothetical protein
MTNDKRLPEPEHSTIIFSLRGAMDDQDASAALRRLGVGLGSRPGPAPGRSCGRQAVDRWSACGLRSDGLVELWLTLNTPEGRDGASLELQLDEAGLPYAVYRPLPFPFPKIL